MGRGADGGGWGGGVSEVRTRSLFSQWKSGIVIWAWPVSDETQERTELSSNRMTFDKNGTAGTSVCKFPNDMERRNEERTKTISSILEMRKRDSTDDVSLT